MDGDIDQVVTENLILAEVIIESEREAGDRAVDPAIATEVCEKGFLDALPIESLEVEGLIGE